ncbi:MAG: urease accessory protein UreF [Rhodospirillaceae bacterium]|jgi:urease accessory protein|nr:urease accessory protein UreF [Rhodospirillaceae bacterium]
MTTDEALLDLMNWLSPSFPVGGYVYSHGIEMAVEEGQIYNEQELVRWISAALTQGAGRIDGGLFKAAWQAVEEGDSEALKSTIELGDILRGTSEMALESAAQGQAFMDTILQTRDFQGLKEISENMKADNRKASHAIAVAIVAALAGIQLRPALLAYYHGFTTNLVSAGIRLVPLGQIAGQRSIEALKPTVAATSQAVLDGELDTLGTAAPVIDWASMKHETQYTRLFRS